ncbi:hypothetical protein T492DRAFT_1039154 [Pavlovales sp. CCMP2436]|nr:hypothetical protein T492DRAFT_1039154 [Pavlovales sp. CCMP2436]
MLTKVLCAFGALGAPGPAAVHADGHRRLRAFAQAEPSILRGGWNFSYVPGPAELPWLASLPIDGRACETAAEPTQVAMIKEALRLADQLRAAPATLPAATVDDSSPLSHMVYCHGAANPGQPSGACRVEPIEPLNGFGRHPFAEVGCNLQQRSTALAKESSIFDIDFMVLASRCAEQPGRPAAPPSVHTGKNYFFDAGCSVYSRPRSSRQSKAMMGSVRGALGGSARGPSIPLFSDLYKARCIEFDGIWAWEAHTFRPEKWWRNVPLEVRHKLHFFNIPIESAGGASDVLDTIGQVARPEDFVVLKLDIDTFEVERQVVEELRTNARKTNASSLVDEFFFEYHFLTPNEPHLHHYWMSSKRGGSIDDAVALMHDLRAKGVRSHFWI